MKLGRGHCQAAATPRTPAATRNVLIHPAMRLGLQPADPFVVCLQV